MEKEVDIDLPEHDNQDYARRIIEQKRYTGGELNNVLMDIITVTSMFSYMRYIDCIISDTSV